MKLIMKPFFLPSNNAHNTTANKNDLLPRSVKVIKMYDCVIVYNLCNSLLFECFFLKSILCIVVVVVTITSIVNCVITHVYLPYAMPYGDVGEV